MKASRKNWTHSLSWCY